MIDSGAHKSEAVGAVLYAICVPILAALFFSFILDSEYGRILGFGIGSYIVCFTYARTAQWRVVLASITICALGLSAFDSRFDLLLARIVLVLLVGLITWLTHLGWSSKRGDPTDGI